MNPEASCLELFNIERLFLAKCSDCAAHASRPAGAGEIHFRRYLQP